MALARLFSRGLSGLDAYEVTVEVHLSNGLPGLSVTGLPNASVRESKDRVRAALDTCGFSLPQRRVTVHLGPAEIPKDGGRFDLAIALGVIKAHCKMPWDLEATEFIGELALNGDLRGVSGALPSVLAADRASRRVFVPSDNAAEAGLAPQATVFAASNLHDVLAHLNDTSALQRVLPTVTQHADRPVKDLSDVCGQGLAKRALAVAAAGGHNLLMIGPPGSGKSMLAERLRGLLPRLPVDDQICLASIASLNGRVATMLDSDEAPFRAPHHTISAQALVGGGSRPKPGEVSLAHLGMLFLDELPEFSRRSLEALREPLETGVVRISRVREQVSFPAQFQLVAAMNPCPCGFHGDGTDRCDCTPTRIGNYRNRISGPMLDRFDMHVEVPRVALAELTQTRQRGETQRIRAVVDAARETQLRRAGVLNAHLTDEAFWDTIELGPVTDDLFETAVRRWRLSARSAVRLLKTARTIADIERCDHLMGQHIAEAMQMRCMDRPDSAVPARRITL